MSSRSCVTALGLGGQRAVREYLRLMVAQRKAVERSLAGLPEQVLWQRPAPKEWCIGEILDHTRVLNRSTLRLFRVAWAAERPVARMFRHRSYRTGMSNPYTEESWAMKFGWLWHPRATPRRAVTFQALMEGLQQTHDTVAHFYAARPPDVLGHVVLWDPVIGCGNLIQWLRVGIYHDELHYRDATALAAQLRL
jgi:hypothetical protein